jgi:hypothetical protein
MLLKYKDILIEKCFKKMIMSLMSIIKTRTILIFRKLLWENFI